MTTIGHTQPQFAGVYRCLLWRQVLRRSDVLSKQGLGVAPTKSWLALITKKLSQSAGLLTKEGQAAVIWDGIHSSRHPRIDPLFLADDRFGNHATRFTERNGTFETFLDFNQSAEHWAQNPNGYFLIPPVKWIPSKFTRLWIVPKPIHQWIEKRLIRQTEKAV